MPLNKTTSVSAPHAAIIGGGIAGSTAAIHLAEQGIKVTLFEQGPGLVNGPPICHLHAGGNLYREISNKQCIELLKQSVETVRLYPHAVNIRPTVIATPKKDKNSAQALLPRLEAIRSAYRELVAEDEENAVLGSPEDYFRLYHREELEMIAKRKQPSEPAVFDDWMIPFAREVRLDALKYPVVAVQEFGLSLFRLAASVTLALNNHPYCTVQIGCTLQSAERQRHNWILGYQDAQGQEQNIEVDYLINAAGYRTGMVDDLAGQPRQRLVEFKSAYITRWPVSDMSWPEVIFHGERGTPQGMAQLTPYADGYFQLHGMTENITLFKGGLVASGSMSSQPKLPDPLERKITSGWSEDVMEQRTERAIEHMSQYIPNFHLAEFGGKPLFGAQQIPGTDATLRAVDVSFTDNSYARVEIVKASSAYQAAKRIRQQLVLEWAEKTKVGCDGVTLSPEKQHPRLADLKREEVERLAIRLAQSRHYPEALAKFT
ncbi:FAD-dependent oxidoreductase [Vibrio sp. HA2012]|uniref:FAD-dependent oxidoreductase n=1 Tax=Vibrio sp. HA2012 TaxID=1971595 RepID=UPI000C2BC542|nr:FAD-dependent oxidoreductase [Vibrio sp. HA2012]PJC87877.1 FAD-dependent oxidoreductase [Vibrio sp. HA2012]